VWCQIDHRVRCSICDLLPLVCEAALGLTVLPRRLSRRLQNLLLSAGTT